MLMRVFEWGANQAKCYEEEDSIFTATKPPSKEKIRKTVHVRRKKLSSTHSTSQLQTGIVHREAVEALRTKIRHGSETTRETLFELMTEDTLDFFKAGVETICLDDINQVMSAQVPLSRPGNRISRRVLQELPCWNFLTRYRQMYPHLTWRLRLLWYLGFIVRYFILYPVRLLLLLAGPLWLGIGALMLDSIESMIKLHQP